MYASHFVGHTSLERLLEQAKSVRASMFVDSFALNDPTPTGMYNRRTLIQAGFFDGNIATCGVGNWPMPCSRRMGNRSIRNAPNAPSLPRKPPCRRSSIIWRISMLSKP